MDTRDNRYDYQDQAPRRDGSQPRRPQNASGAGRQPARRRPAGQPYPRDRYGQQAQRRVQYDGRDRIREEYDRDYPVRRDARLREQYQPQPSRRRPSESTRRPVDSRPRSTRSSSRDVYIGSRPSVLDTASALVADNMLVRSGIILVLVLLVLFILFNAITCIGGALSGQQAQTAADVATEASTESSAESGSAAEGTESSSSSQAQEGVVSPWTESGYFSTGDSELDNYVKQFCDEHSTEGATFAENAEATNLVISTQAGYVERENNQSPWGPDWDVEYAKQFFESGNAGNCYNSAAVTQFILQYFGYSDAEGQPCVVELESGNWGDHGLVFLTDKSTGKRAIVDDALGGNGWMLDIDAYNYDIRNINQNATVKGNVDAIDDEPMQIPPGELTE